MSNSVQPHRRQPNRLPGPWYSPGKNTGVGCHFLLQCMKVKSESEVAQSCPTLCNPLDCSLPGSSIHGIFQARVLEWGAIAFFMKSMYMYINLNHFEKLTQHCKSTISSVQLNSIACYVQIFVIPWTAALQASLSITNSQSFLKLMSIELVMPSNHLILCHPLFLLPSIFPNIRVFSNESILHIRWPKYWSFSYSISLSNEY